jgi:hypothetical protein
LQREELLTFDALATEAWFGGRRAFNDDFLAAASGKEVPRHPMHRRAIYCLEGLADTVLCSGQDFCAGFAGPAGPLG